MIMKKIEVLPKGAIISPNRITRHGMVRHRAFEPTMPVSISSI